MWHIERNDSRALRRIFNTAIRWVRIRQIMDNTLLLTKISRSMIIASMILGLTGAAYAQSGPGGAGGAAAAGGGSAGVRIR